MKTFSVSLKAGLSRSVCRAKAGRRSIFGLREELRELEINLFLYQYDKSNERLQQLRGVARQLSGEIPAALAEEEAYAAGCAKEEELERSLSAAISETSRTLI